MRQLGEFLRIDKETSPSRVASGRKPLDVYVFRCRSCPAEIRSRRAYRAKHSGLCVPCSNRRSLPAAQEARRLRPYESVWNYLKSQDPQCDLTYEAFLVFTEQAKCHYCAGPLAWEPFGKATTFNLDRKDNARGHVEGNLVVCCGDCNKTKGDRFTYAEFVRLAPVLKAIREERLDLCTTSSHNVLV